MPTYTYRCVKCGDEITAELSFLQHETFLPPAHYLGRKLCGKRKQVLSANIDKNSLKQHPKKTK